jgi:hypothetical protein
LEAGEYVLALSITGGKGVVYTETVWAREYAFPTGLDARIWRLYVFAINGMDVFPVLLMMNVYELDPFGATLEFP